MDPTRVVPNETPYTRIVVRPNGKKVYFYDYQKRTRPDGQEYMVRVGIDEQDDPVNQLPDLSGAGEPGADIGSDQL